MCSGHCFVLGWNVSQKQQNTKAMQEKASFLASKRAHLPQIHVFPSGLIWFHPLLGPLVQLLPSQYNWSGRALLAVFLSRGITSEEEKTKRREKKAIVSIIKQSTRYNKKIVLQQKCMIQAYSYHNSRSAYEMDFLLDQTRFDFPTMANDSSDDIFTPVSATSCIFHQWFATWTTWSKRFTLTVSKIGVEWHWNQVRVKFHALL